MQQVVTDHEWSSPIVWTVFKQYVGHPNNTLEYRQALLDSSFTLCPVGAGDDSFRFWEAIEAGSIPILVPRDTTLHGTEERGDYDCPDAFQDVLRTNPPIVVLKSWHELPGFIESSTEESTRRLRKLLYIWNHEWWTNTTRMLDTAINERGLLTQVGA